jgi:hypothetical protein
MWRILMLEDAVFNATIATTRRHAAPLRVAKLGDPATSYIPDPEVEERLLGLLAESEGDTLSWLVWNYGLNFELVGVTDRIMSIRDHWELCERVKLIALGISKGFLHGEVTYASAASGLTVFLQRLKAMRDLIETLWLYPKFFQPVSVMRGFIKPTQAEAASASDKGPYVMTRRSYRELIEDGRYVSPKAEWDRQLDPTVEQAQITAVQALKQMGVPFSKQYLASLVACDWEEQLQQRMQEVETEQQYLQANPALAGELAPPAGPGGGAAPGTIMPGLPPGTFGDEGGELGAEPPPAEGAPPGMEAAPGEEGAPGAGPWNGRMVQDLVRVFEGHPPEQEPWVGMLEDPQVSEAVATGIPEEIWYEVQDWLSLSGYGADDMRQLEDVLKRRRVLTPREAEFLEKEADKLDSENELDDVYSLYRGAP